MRAEDRAVERRTDTSHSAGRESKAAGSVVAAAGLASSTVFGSLSCRRRQWAVQSEPSVGGVSAEASVGSAARVLRGGARGVRGRWECRRCGRCGRCGRCSSACGLTRAGRAHARMDGALASGGAAHLELGGLGGAWLVIVARSVGVRRHPGREGQARWTRHDVLPSDRPRQRVAPLGYLDPCMWRVLLFSKLLGW